MIQISFIKKRINVKFVWVCRKIKTLINHDIEKIILKNPFLKITARNLRDGIFYLWVGLREFNQKTAITSDLRNQTVIEYLKSLEICVQSIQVLIKILLAGFILSYRWMCQNL